MYKIILVEPNQASRIQVLKEFFESLSALLNIKGFSLEHQAANNQWHLSLLSRQSLTIPLHFTPEAPPIADQIQPYLETLLLELSVFELVDIFLLNRLATIELEIPRLKQQIITVFSSKIPVISTVKSKDLDKLDYLPDYIPIKLIDLQKTKETDVFAQLIKELYDF